MSPSLSRDASEKPSLTLPLLQTRMPPRHRDHLLSFFRGPGPPVCPSGHPGHTDDRVPHFSAVFTAPDTVLLLIRSRRSISGYRMSLSERVLEASFALSLLCPGEGVGGEGWGHVWQQQLCLPTPSQERGCCFSTGSRADPSLWAPPGSALLHPGRLFSGGTGPDARTRPPSGRACVS